MWGSLRTDCTKRVLWYKIYIIEYAPCCEYCEEYAQNKLCEMCDENTKQVLDLQNIAAAATGKLTVSADGAAFFVFGGFNPFLVLSLPV